MKAKGIILGLIAACAATSIAAPFSAGNVVVYRVGGTAAELATGLVNTGNSVWLDEYTTAGTLVQSVNVTSLWGSQALVASGTATSEGLITLNNNLIALTGYNRAIGGTGSLASTTGAAVNRSVGLVNLSGSLVAQANFSDFADGNNPRSAVAGTGGDIWFTGGAGGARYGTTAGGTSTQLSTTVANLRQINIFNGQLYTSTSSGTAVRLGSIGSGTPTTTGQTITNLGGFPTSGSPYAYYFADLSVSEAGLDTVYVADDTAGLIQKYTSVGGVWGLTGSISATSVRGLTGTVTANGVQLYASTGASTATGGGSIYSALDSSGYNGTASGTASSIVTLTAGTLGQTASTAFRGIVYIPQAVPEPGTLAALAVGAIAIVRRPRAK